MAGRPAFLSQYAHDEFWIKGGGFSWRKVICCNYYWFDNIRHPRCRQAAQPCNSTVPDIMQVSDPLCHVSSESFQQHRVIFDSTVNCVGRPFPFFEFFIDRFDQPLVSGQLGGCCKDGFGFFIGCQVTAVSQVLCYSLHGFAYPGTACFPVSAWALVRICLRRRHNECHAAVGCPCVYADAVQYLVSVRHTNRLSFLYLFLNS